MSPLYHIYVCVCACVCVVMCCILVLNLHFVGFAPKIYMGGDVVPGKVVEGFI